MYNLNWKSSPSLYVWVYDALNGRNHHVIEELTAHHELIDFSTIVNLILGTGISAMRTNNKCVINITKPSLEFQNEGLQKLQFRNFPKLYRRRQEVLRNLLTKRTCKKKQVEVSHSEVKLNIYHHYKLNSPSSQAYLGMDLLLNIFIDHLVSNTWYLMSSSLLSIVVKTIEQALEIMALEFTVWRFREKRKHLNTSSAFKSFSVSQTHTLMYMIIHRIILSEPNSNRNE